MKTFKIQGFCQSVLLLFMMSAPGSSFAQGKDAKFWDHVQFGGGLGLSFGNQFTNVTVAPAAIYNFNEYFAAGVGLQGSYVKVREEYQAYIYGGSLITLVNPIDEIQLSAELEQMRVNVEYDLEGFEGVENNFWNTALFLGAGYRSEHFTLGVRYNVLYDEDDGIYGSPFMPFVRVFF